MASIFRLFAGPDRYIIWTEMFFVDIEAVAVWRTLTRRVHECLSTRVHEYSHLLEYMSTRVHEYRVHGYMSTGYMST